MGRGVRPVPEPPGTPTPGPTAETDPQGTPVSKMHLTEEDTKGTRSEILNRSTGNKECGMNNVFYFDTDTDGIGGFDPPEPLFVTSTHREPSDASAPFFSKRLFWLVGTRNLPKGLPPRRAHGFVTDGRPAHGAQRAEGVRGLDLTPTKKDKYALGFKKNISDY